MIRLDWIEFQMPQVAVNQTLTDIIFILSINLPACAFLQPCAEPPHARGNRMYIYP